MVEGDGGFVAAGFSGSGTSGDPYVLSDVYVNATGHHHGIFISNTTKHFIITNCRASDAFTSEIDTLDLQESGSGILLYNVSNGTIEDTVADYNARGIDQELLSKLELISSLLMMISFHRLMM